MCNNGNGADNSNNDTSNNHHADIYIYIYVCVCVYTRIYTAIQEYVGISVASCDYIPSVVIIYQAFARGCHHPSKKTMEQSPQTGCGNFKMEV